MAKYDIDTTDLQKRRRNSSVPSLTLLIMDRLAMIKNLSGGGDERNQVSELLTEVLDA